MSWKVTVVKECSEKVCAVRVPNALLELVKSEMGSCDTILIESIPCLADELFQRTEMEPFKRVEV